MRLPLGVDEVSVGKGKFWALVYQIDEGAAHLALERLRLLLKVPHQGSHRATA
jgi:hypothetical protein